MDVRQLLLISVLCSFSVRAMEEIKFAEENPVVKSIRTTKLEKLNKYVPNTVIFLFKVLGEKGVPDEVIKEIILFLRTDVFQISDARGNCEFHGQKWVRGVLYIPYGEDIVERYSLIHCSLYELLKGIHEHNSFNKLTSYDLLIDGSRPLTSYSDFAVTIRKSKKIADLDIDKCNIKASNVINHKIVSWIKNHKSEFLAVISLVVAILGYGKQTNKIKG